MRFSRLFSDGIGRCIGRCYKACSGQNCHEQKAGDRLHRLAMACPSSCVQDGALDGPLAGRLDGLCSGMAAAQRLALMCPHLRLLWAHVRDA